MYLPLLVFAVDDHNDDNDDDHDDDYDDDGDEDDYDYEAVRYGTVTQLSIALVKS